MTSAKKLVSIGVPTYNRSRYLAATVESLLAQDYRNIEIIVSDNASSDKTREVVRQLQKRDSRLRYHRNEHNEGIIANFNRAFHEARGTYVAIAGDDDLYEPNYISRCLAQFAAIPTAGLVACAVDLIDADGTFLRAVSEQAYLRAPLSDCVADAKHVLYAGYGNLLMGIFRRDVLGGTSLFRYTWGSYIDSADIVVLFDVALRAPIIWIPDVLIHKRTGGYSSQPVYRSAGAVAATATATARELVRRSRSVPLSAADRRRLLRIVHRWSLSLFFAYRAEFCKSLVRALLPTPFRNHLRNAIRSRQHGIRQGR
jgi:glycosyltransferase involved in cell wall biosynthesis